MGVNPFGRHLHSQLIWPLAVAALVVAVLATAIALRVIESQVLTWTDQAAVASASVVTTRIAHRASTVKRSLDLITTDPRFTEAVAAGDTQAMTDYLSFAALAVRADGLMVLDESERVIESVGDLTLDVGDRPFAESGEEWLEARGSATRMTEADGSCVVAVATGFDGPEGEIWHLVASIVMSDHLIADLTLGLDASFGLVDEGGEVAAFASEGEVAREDVAAFVAATPPPVARDTAEEPPVATAVRFGDADYRVVALPIDPAVAGVAGPSVFAIVPTDLAVEARMTTAYLIAMWFLVGLAALGVLNWYVRFKVSRPIALLSESAERVSSGDFTVAPDISGHNEIADLADSFSRMTGSLKERSDSLTKKVLELATLYEMSRSLGSTLELETLLDSVLDSAMRIFDVELGYVTMVDRETGALAVATWRGADLSHADDAAIRASMSDWVVREARPLIFNPPVGGAPVGDDDGRVDSVSGALAALCVPLMSNEGTIGAITVGSRDADRRFTSDDVRLLATIANHVTIAVGNISLFSSVQEAYLATVRALAAAVDAKDPYTRGHSDGVAAYALQIGEEMRLSAEQMVSLEMAAYLHDIGKIGISEDILLKPGKLTDAEMSQMRHHPLIGANILKPVAFPWPIAPIVRHHHEHYNGEGYPAGLRGEEIPVLARVLTVADAFEAMVADRPYRRGRSHQEAILELRRCAGTQFDPRVVDAFIRVLESSQRALADDQVSDEEAGPVEIQAVLVALADGIFSSFRRLGGPRLANNLERVVNERFTAAGAPLALRSGHVVIEGEDLMSESALSEHLGFAIAVISEQIEGASGAGLADHFLADALDGLPERMRACARRLGYAPVA
jgi:putative nucleotidyltransferase with HDIG domain